MRSLLAVVILILGLTSCARPGDIVKIMSRIDERSYIYREGYTDGCGSGLRQRGDQEKIFFKDLLRFEDGSEYREGWQEGFKKCSG